MGREQPVPFFETHRRPTHLAGVPAALPVSLTDAALGPNTAGADSIPSPGVDLVREPPDARLVDAIGAERCIAERLVPWRCVGGAVLVAMAAPERFSSLRSRLESSLGPVIPVAASERDILDSVVALRKRHLALKAETRAPVAESCRRPARPGLRWLLATLALAAVAALLAAPATVFVILLTWALLWSVAANALRLAAAAAVLLRDRPEPETVRPLPLGRPVVSVLVPLFRERAIAEQLVRRLERISYPRERLDILLVVESDDRVTRATLAEITLPHWMRTVVVPAGTLRTKPRALNYALDFCRGSIVGIYDAEDAPAPDQIARVADRFAEAPREVACLQGILDFYNASENWLARCFTIEYATWFRIVLPGLQRLGLVLPLGGTTLFLRREVLEEVGGWDAHNVTEDAELGLRLARRGYRTELIASVTEEEANARLWPWIRQRSRWLKGYAKTWGVHMRAPRAMLRELGFWRTAGVQILFFGTLMQFLSAPLFWSFWLLLAGLPHPLAESMSMTAFAGLWASFMLLEVLNLAISGAALKLAGKRRMLGWVVTLPLYFPLATVALLKGLAELCHRPFYWDKTEHGRSKAIGG